MASTKIRHLVERPGPQGVRFYWQPSKTIVSLGMSAEALGHNRSKAEYRATILNTQADELRRAAQEASTSPAPGTVARLFKEYRASDEFSELKPRTQADYRYEMDKIEEILGAGMVRSLTPKALKTLYKGLLRDKSITVAYHRLSVFRSILSWAVSEDWISTNPALDVRIKSPRKRAVVWSQAQMQAYIAKAEELGWHSIVAMIHVFDSIGQSPVDVRTLLRGSYAHGRINVSRQKTGVKGAPIPLFPDAVIALDAYLATQPAKLPTAPLFICERTNAMWGESNLQHTHAKIRSAAKLPKELQLQDFRTTVQTEGGAAGGTVDELKGLARHLSRAAGEHYVHPDGRFVDSIQGKRLALRSTNKNPTSES